MSDVYAGDYREARLVSSVCPRSSPSLSRRAGCGGCRGPVPVALGCGTPLSQSRTDYDPRVMLKTRPRLVLTALAFVCASAAPTMQSPGYPVELVAPGK